ncbi:MAG: hypothetical protein Q9160_008733 [Pyrenula sp. 1 TL-2023]
MAVTITSSGKTIVETQSVTAMAGGYAWVLREHSGDTDAAKALKPPPVLGTHPSAVTCQPAPNGAAPPPGSSSDVSTKTPAPGNTPIETPSPGDTPVHTPTPDDTPVHTPTPDDTPVHTPTPGDTPANKPTPSDTPANKPTPGNTPANKPTPGDTPANKPTPGDTPANKPTPGDTPANKPTPGDTPVNKPTPGDTPVNTPTPEGTPVNKPTPSPPGKLPNESSSKRPGNLVDDVLTPSLIEKPTPTPNPIPENPQEGPSCPIQPPKCSECAALTGTPIFWDVPASPTTVPRRNHVVPPALAPMGYAYWERLQVVTVTTLVPRILQNAPISCAKATTWAHVPATTRTVPATPAKTVPSIWIRLIAKTAAEATTTPHAKGYVLSFTLDPNDLNKFTKKPKWQGCYCMDGYVFQPYQISLDPGVPQIADDIAGQAKKPPGGA